MARHAAEFHHAVAYRGAHHKTVDDSPIAIDLLNQALHRKSRAKPASEYPVRERIDKHSTKQSKKPKMVSAAGMFKKKGKRGASESKRRWREQTPETDMMVMVRGNLLFRPST
jgi:hypothetical protein